ncbi:MULTISPECIES: hypothetical protein [unclassified Streptomyces]|uniref:hypothetical protein n=1 Tax=unclassified Streptomyces TaxID=2593676 RepID=UPI001F4DAAF0|nr:hypothetical protein [Streptomyces sp. AmelKG-D3]
MRRRQGSGSGGGSGAGASAGARARGGPEETAARTPRESPLPRTDGGAPEALGSAPAVLGGGPGFLGGGPGVLGGGPRSLSGMQRTLGNAATARAVGRGKRPAFRPSPPAIDERAEQGLVLPPYLMDLEAGGLSTAYGLTGHEFVRSAVAAVVGHGGGTVAGIAAELAGRPESFFGRGRAFAVEAGPGGGSAGAQGGGGHDVTVSIAPAPDDRPPTFHPAAGLGTAAPDPGGAPLAAVDDAEGKETKVDVQHNTGATASRSVGNSASKGVGGTAFGLAPVAPGLWLGGAATGNVQPWQSSRDSRSQRGVAEPRVLRSDKGSVEVARRVVYVVRVRPQAGGGEQVFRGSGGLTQRVPTEHLIPAGTGAPARPEPVDAGLARRVALADSLAPLGVFDEAGPHRGGGGLFDAVASVLHPSLTAPGAPGRARLYEATATPTVLEDLPRLLGGDGVTGDDLYAKDGSSAGSYRMRAAVTGLAPAWSTGKTQLRTHQQAQHTATESAGKGRAVAGGIGPAAGVGAAANAAVVRATAMPVAAARKARFSVNEQTVSSRQGAEVRGEKVLYTGTVRFTVEGTGPRSMRMIRHPEARVATHAMRVWISLRADEAQELGLPLPPGVTAGRFIRPPRPGAAPTPAAGGEGEASAPAAAGAGAERHLPFGAMGSSVTLGRLDTAPMMKAVRELFATDPRLTGYLPAFGTTPPAAGLGQDEAAAQRANHRELTTALSEANLRVNKDQLLSTGIRVRLRRKTAMHSHDVQLRVHGTMGEADHLGDIDDWLVRAHAGVASNAQSGRSSSRSIGGMVLAQARLIPGALTGSARYERATSGTRRNQAGPTTRTDVLNNGSEKAAAFGAALRLNVDVTMTSRPRKMTRALTPGAPGRDVPEAKLLSGLHLEEQDVRLLTPTEFTVGAEEKRRLDAGAGRAPGAESATTATGIGDLAGAAPAAPTGQRLVQDWQLVETVGDGRPIRELALSLLSRAAARGEAGRRDAALATEGLAPRLAVEERFSPRAITASLRQAASSGWVVKNLRYPRRLAALNGAVGTRLALSATQLVHEAAGPGTETFVLGGHQAGGQQGGGTSTTVQAGATLVQNGADWRVGEGLSAYGSTGTGDSEAATVAVTVERNAHTPKKAPLYLVRCDLLVTMVAEVKVTGGGPYAASAARTLPGAAAVWLTAAQLRAAGVDLPRSARKELKADGTPAPTTSTSAVGVSGAGSGVRSAARSDHGPGTRSGVGSGPGEASGGGPRPRPTLSRGLPLGFGMIEDVPDFVPLLSGLRTTLALTGRQDLADDLLPGQQLRDRNDNVQRLLRVLDRDGSTGLLASAMDGGVTVELLDGRRTPYWAVFKVDRVGDGVWEGEADDGRDMEYITSAVAQQSTAHDEGESVGVEGVLAASGRPDGGKGQVKSTGAAAGLGLAKGSGRRRGGATRGQLGMKTVAEAKTAKAARIRIPVVPSLELHRGDRRLAVAGLGRTTLVHRVLEADLKALSRVTTPRRPAAHPRPDAPQGSDAALGAWRASGVPLPMEAQVNGFQGAPRVRDLVSRTVQAAGGNPRFREKGQAAAYTLGEAVSTEWLIAALPLLTHAGAPLPPVHATGAKGQDLHASVHARLRAGRILGAGDKMTFETVAQSDLTAPRPTQTDAQSAAEKSRQARGLLGAGVLNADEFRLNQLMANGGGAGSATDASAGGAGSMPLHKPKFASVLVQFTLDVRVVARVTDRVLSSRTAVAERELTLPQPVVVRMPLPVARRLLAAYPEAVADSRGELGV